MKEDPAQESRRGTRTATLALFAAGCVALAAALLVGIADNPPGLVLLYLAITAWTLAVVHRWRRVKPFLLLLAGSVLAFALGVVLHNVFYALGILAGDKGILGQALGLLGGAFFLLAVLASPVGAAVGAVGSATLAIRHWVRGRPPAESS